LTTLRSLVRLGAAMTHKANAGMLRLRAGRCLQREEEAAS
jgi:hypothetical protein